MDSGLVVYDDTGTTVFDKSTRTFKIVIKIPFSRALRFTTQVFTDPLFITESMTWFFSARELYNDLIVVTQVGDTVTVRVNTFYKIKNDGSRYEDASVDWNQYNGTHIMLGVY